MNNKSFIIILILIVAAGLKILQQQHAVVFPTRSNVTIERGETSYEPKIISIRQGTTVTFLSKQKKSFWPASDPHPVHDIYPEFDPKRSVQPDESWSFRFDKAGTWSYHDHLAPNVAGSIIVIGQKQEYALFTRVSTWIRSLFETMVAAIGTKPITSAQAIAKCNAVTSSQEAHQQCWKDIFRSIVMSRGVDAGLSFLSEVKDTNIVFATECHVYAHTIGELSYERFVRGSKKEITGDVSMCNLGYFHGFMQEYVSHGKDLMKAKNLCDLQKTSKPNDDTDENRLTQCFHGIGHGLAYWYGAGENHTETVVIQKSLAGCRLMFPTDSPSYFECANGVYGGIAAFYFTLHGFSYTMRIDNPFWVCRMQPDDLKRFCYDELVPPLYNIVGFDLIAAGHIIEKIEDRTLAVLTMEHLGWMPAHRNLITEERYAEVVKQCRVFPDDFARSCLRGVVKSLVNFGNIQEAIPRAVRFCNEYVKDIGFGQECQNTLFEQIRYAYSLKRQKDICVTFSGLIPAFCDSLQ